MGPARLVRMDPAHRPTGEMLLELVIAVILWQAVEGLYRLLDRDGHGPCRFEAFQDGLDRAFPSGDLGRTRLRSALSTAILLGFFLWARRRLWPNILHPEIGLGSLIFSVLSMASGYLTLKAVRGLLDRFRPKAERPSWGWVLGSLTLGPLTFGILTLAAHGAISIAAILHSLLLTGEVFPHHLEPLRTTLDTLSRASTWTLRGPLGPFIWAANAVPLWMVLHTLSATWPITPGSDRGPSGTGRLIGLLAGLGWLLIAGTHRLLWPL